MASTYGEGSVYLRTSDMRWVAKYSPRQGVKPKVFYGKTEAEVRRKLRAFKKSPEATLLSDPAKVTVENYFNNWLSMYKKPALKATSYDRLDSVIRNYIVPHMGSVSISNVTSNDCQNLLNKMIEDGLSYSAVRKVYDTMASCFKHATLSEDILKNPMLVVTAPSQNKFDNKDARALTTEEETRFLNELNTQYTTGRAKYIYKHAYIIMLNTGLREGELVALDWADVDLDEKIIHIRKNAVFVSERDADGVLTGRSVQIVQETPKSKSGNRDIPLNTKALNAFKELRNAHPASAYVLTTATGERATTSALIKQVKRAYDKAMIPNATVHTLRHTFATRLFEKGASVKDVSVLLGHSGVGITYNTYVHVIKERKQDVVGLLE